MEEENGNGIREEIARVKRKKGENPAAAHRGGERGGQQVRQGRRIFQ